jgi:hypothetical protein
MERDFIMRRKRMQSGDFVVIERHEFRSVNGGSGRSKGLGVASVISKVRRLRCRYKGFRGMGAG